MDISFIHSLFLKCSSVSIDTRKIEKDTFFVAIKGENFDANTFAKEALDKGALYAIIDNELGNIGNISEIDEKTENVIIKVIHPTGVEIILPFNDDFIIEIDDDLKTIHFNAPKGLVEMYL